MARSINRIPFTWKLAKQMSEIFMNSSISFIVPAYNCSGTLAEAIESIFDGNFEDGDEIIIINDASTDETQNVIEELKKNHAEIVAVKHNINKGTAAAGRNTGIDYARNSLYFCLDSDNILAPKSVPRLKDYMLSAKADAAAFGEIRYFLDTPNNVTHKWVFKQGVITLSDALVGPVWPGPSGNYLFTRASWLKAGRYFEPSLINQTIDSWTFTIRQIATGSKFIVFPETYYLHRCGTDSHFIREYKKGNVSLAALSGLIPILGMIDDSDVDYIMSSQGRYSWFENLDKHPLRVKGEQIGQTGTATLAKQTIFKRILRKLSRLINMSLRIR